MRSSTSIQSEIQALIVQKADREADLKRHTTKQCRCKGKSPLRCEGMQNAAKSVISKLRAEIYHLRQLELRAITREKANEDAFQISGTNNKQSNPGRKISRKNSGNRRAQTRSNS